MTEPELRVLPAGDLALLLAPSDPADLEPFVDHLRLRPPDGVEDILPAAETVLVTLVPGADPAAVRTRLLERFADSRSGAALSDDRAEEPLTIRVRYDGADLAEVAALLGRSAADVVSLHTGCEWRCAFLGFAPGFGYLTSPDRRLAVPRRRQARTRVPAGAVALADGYTAVYPRPSPGGWQIIGTTDVALWDLGQDPPSLLHPGRRVRFRVEQP